MLCVGLAAKYPALLWLSNAGFGCGALSESGALFLMHAVQYLWRDLQGVHWSGSAAQLGAPALTEQRLDLGNSL